MNPFSGLGNNVAVSASVTTASGTLPGRSTDASVCRVYNPGTGVAFVRFGTTAVGSAVTTDAFVAPGVTEVFALPPGVTTVSVILSASTATVYFQRGGGI